jgi:hypothetical protein
MGTHVSRVTCWMLKLCFKGRLGLHRLVAYGIVVADVIIWLCVGG